MHDFLDENQLMMPEAMGRVMWLPEGPMTLQAGESQAQAHINDLS